MSLQDFPEENRFNEGVFRFVSYSLVALMLAAAALTLVHVIIRFSFGRAPWYLSLICFGVALDRQYTYRSFKKLTAMSSEFMIAYGSHLVVIALLVKIIVGLSHGITSFLAEIPLWRRGFFDYFLTPEFIFSLLVATIIWFISGYIAELLDEIGLDQVQMMRDMQSPVKSDKRSARERLLGLVFGLGIVLILMTAMTRVEFRGLFQEGGGLEIYDMPPLAGGGWSTLLYFMLGLALLSQTQFVSLHTRWIFQRVSVQQKIAGQWALYSILFLLVLAIIISVLPTSYSLGFLTVLRIVLAFIFQILTFIYKLIFTVFVYLIRLIFLLLGMESPELPEIPDTPIFLPQQSPGPVVETPDAPVPWLELVKSLLFWSIFLGILIYSLVHYLRQHREILDRLRSIPGWSLLERFWGWLRSFFGGVNQRVAELVRTGRERIRLRRRDVSLDEIGKFLSVRKLTPRQRVYFFYHALIRRGGERGLSRRDSQTPLEYASTLEDALPAVDEDVESITDAFIEARYSRNEIEMEDANLVKQYWERIRRALRRKRE